MAPAGTGVRLLRLGFDGHERTGSCTLLSRHQRIPRLLRFWGSPAHSCGFIAGAAGGYHLSCVSAIAGVAFFAVFFCRWRPFRSVFPVAALGAARQPASVRCGRRQQPAQSAPCVGDIEATAAATAATPAAAAANVATCRSRGRDGLERGTGERVFVVKSGECWRESADWPSIAVRSRRISRARKQCASLR